MEIHSGLSNVQGPWEHFQLLPKGLSEADMLSSSPTNISMEPSWLEDLLNEPDTPAKCGHRRSASDPFACIGGDSRGEELWLGIGNTAWGFQTPQYPNYRAPSTRKMMSFCEEQHDSNVRSATEDAGCNLRWPSEPNHTMFAGSDILNQEGVASNTSENTSGGSNSSLAKPRVAQPPLNTDVKQKQNNTRRSRARKLQYIAELERNVQVLQVEGVAVSAQLEFLDQQNLILAMENRALKQRLESLSQEHFIKSLEQDILDRELGRLQYLYHAQNLNHHQLQWQRPKQKAGNHRRGRSCDVGFQFSKISLRPTEPMAGRK